MCIGYYWLALAHNSTDMPCSYQQLDTWVCEDAGGLVMMFCNNTVTTELEKKSVKYMCFTLTLRSYLLPVVMVVVCHCMKPFTLFFTRYFLHKYSSSRLHKYLKCCVQSTVDIRICSVSVGGSVVTFPVQCDLDCFLSVFGAISFRCVCWRDETVCLFIYFFFFFCFFYSHTDLCTQSCSVFFFFPCSASHVTSHDVMIPKESIQLCSGLLLMAALMRCVCCCSFWLTAPWPQLP